MSDVKHMHMVSGVVHAADGLAVEYGPGEMHEPGTLPDGVPFRDVLATPEQIATAPAPAQPVKAAEPEQKPAQADAPKAAAAAGKTSGKA